MAHHSPNPRFDSSDNARCLLCVDDHPEVLAIMGEFLRVSGYSVLTAPSGPRGLQLLQRNPVDAVILDYEMPKMDGAELALRIKSNWPELPVLMFTGYPADVPEDVRGSVDAFVVKGDTAEKLLQTLRDLVPGNGDRSPRKAIRRVRRNGQGAPSDRRMHRPT